MCHLITFPKRLLVLSLGMVFLLFSNGFAGVEKVCRLYKLEGKVESGMACRGADGIWRDVPLVTTKPPQQNLRALVIGNKNYEHAPLTRTITDATDIANTLKQIGFQVTLKTDLDHQTFEDVIEKFLTPLDESVDMALVYYSGHGSQVKGENYLLPINNRIINRENDLSYKAVSANLLQEKLRDTGVKLSVLIIDACRDNPYRSGGKNIPRGLGGLSPLQGSIVAYATAPGEIAKDSSDNNRNGLYALYLKESLLRAHQERWRVDDLFINVANQVREASRGEQVPDYKASLLEVVCFGGCLNSTAKKNQPIVTLEDNVTRYGSDYDSFIPERSDPELCRVACQSNPKCKAFDYVKPGAISAGSLPACWLKEAIPLAVRGNPCCVSGVKIYK